MPCLQRPPAPFYSIVWSLQEHVMDLEADWLVSNIPSLHNTKVSDMDNKWCEKYKGMIDSVKKKSGVPKKLERKGVDFFSISF